MAIPFNIKRGSSSMLPPVNDGTMYYTTDNNKLYIDGYETETIIADGVIRTYSLIKNFFGIKNVMINGVMLNSDKYSYDNSSKKITFTESPEQGATIVITNSVLTRMCASPDIPEPVKYKDGKLIKIGIDNSINSTLGDSIEENVKEPLLDADLSGMRPGQVWGKYNESTYVIEIPNDVMRVFNESDVGTIVSFYMNDEFIENGTVQTNNANIFLGINTSQTIDDFVSSGNIIKNNSEIPAIIIAKQSDTTSYVFSTDEIFAHCIFYFEKMLHGYVRLPDNSIRTDNLLSYNNGLLKFNAGNHIQKDGMSSIFSVGFGNMFHSEQFDKYYFNQQNANHIIDTTKQYYVELGFSIKTINFTNSILPIRFESCPELDDILPNSYFAKVNTDVSYTDAFRNRQPISIVDTSIMIDNTPFSMIIVVTGDSYTCYTSVDNTIMQNITYLCISLCYKTEILDFITINQNAIPTDNYPTQGSHNFINSNRLYYIIGNIMKNFVNRSAKVFNTKQDLDTYISTSFNEIGDVFYIRESGIPDYWWDGTQLQPMESVKLDTSNLVKTEDLSLYYTGDTVDNKLKELSGGYMIRKAYAVEPDLPNNGDIIYNVETKQIRLYNGSVWSEWRSADPNTLYIIM